MYGIKFFALIFGQSKKKYYLCITIAREMNFSDARAVATGPFV